MADQQHISDLTPDVGSGEFATQSAAILREAKRDKALRLACLSLLPFGSLFAILTIVLLPRGVREPYQFAGHLVSLVAVLPVLILGVTSVKRNRRIHRLAGVADAASIGMLLRALRAHLDPGVRSVIRDALTRVLPRATAEYVLDADEVTILNREAERCLLWKWASPGELRCALAAVVAVGVLGNAHSIESLERIIARSPDAEIADMARASLAALRERNDLYRHSLLRPTITSDELLRPTGHYTGEAEQLLRVTDAQAEP